ncbi:lipoate--protein ligase [Pseudoalteromonas sp. S1727]|uniref:lipoate--protein ligase family protein n=1 Tax=Pseudoalteromonas sp. S1727 TaxID=2066514 RepID=UPI001109B362|nr:lipoate--protein ligase [Pseudoalteromonas sp. S1727]TMN71030.1 lipoate--protein ligase [Pseudoalteromonas sp. S1727]
MSKSRNKLLRYSNTTVAAVFEKEAQLITQMQAGELDQCLLLWQSKAPTLVLPAGKKWPETALLTKSLMAHGWQLHSRKTGGAPVPQCEGIINLSHLYTWSPQIPYSITQAYENLCAVLQGFFRQFGLLSQAHATPFSYCDGDYNININGKKIVGTAQRVILKKGGGKIVLAQAFILIDVLLEEIIKPVNLCYALCDKQERVQASAHTSLVAHINEKPSVETLYQQLVLAFTQSKLYS